MKRHINLHTNDELSTSLLKNVDIMSKGENTDFFKCSMTTLMMIAHRQPKLCEKKILLKGKLHRTKTTFNVFTKIIHTPNHENCLICYNGYPPHNFESPKLHKPNIPLRPNICNINDLTYRISLWHISKRIEQYRKT